MKIIKTSQAMPEAGEYVLAWLENTTTPMRAMWVAQFTLPVGDDADPEWGEYSEEKDDYFCPAGWYEMNQHEEQHWGVSGNVVAWCELPRLEAGAAPAAVAGPDIDLAEVDLPDVEDMAHSAVQEALSFGVNHDVFHRWMRAVMDKTVEALAGAPVAAPALEAPAHQCCNSWFLSLPEGRQAVLRENQWMLADAAYQAGCESLKALEAPAAPVLHDIDAGVEVMAWLRENRAPHSIYSKMSACLFGDPDKPRAALAAAPQAPAAPVESKTYSDGTTATGPGALPALSPQQQVLCTLLDTIEAMLGGANGPTIQIRAALLAAPAAPAVDAPAPASEWRDIFTAERSDDLIWLYDANSKTIDGPRTFGTYDVEEYTHWAPAEAPDLDGVDEAFAAAIAAQAKEGGA